MAMPREGAPGWIWWSDRAVRRTPASGASATGPPVSREVALAPSHRADEPPSPRAPGKQVHLVHADRKDCSGHGARVQCPGASVLRFSPPLVALSFTCWSLAVARATQFRRRKRKEPGNARRATALVGPCHASATEEPASPVTLARTSRSAIVRCRDTPVLRSLGDRRDRHQRKPRRGATSASQSQRVDFSSSRLSCLYKPPFSPGVGLRGAPPENE